MVLSAAIDKGLILLSLIAILTSVIGAIYYLNIIKEMFFSGESEVRGLENNISSPISFIISCITLQILLFLFINREWISMGTVLVQILFNG